MFQEIITDKNSLLIKELKLKSFDVFTNETYSKYLDRLDAEYDKDFSSFFQCFQSISEKNIVKAIDILEKSKNICINKYLRKFLEDFNYTFADTKPSIDIWSKTNAAKKEYAFICDVVFRRIIDYDIIPETIIDIGTGDGFLLDKLLSFFTSLKKNVNLILIDKDVNLLNETKTKINKKYPSIKSIQLIHNKIENIDIASLKFNRKTTVINAASVLHELQLHEKKQVISQLKDISSNIFISELESNHDLPDVQYSKLAYSVFKFYDGLILDTLYSANVSKVEKIEFINNYLIFELFHILTNKYENRINYHTTQSGWENVFNYLKWDFDSYVTKFEDYLPNFFTFHLKS